MRFAVPSPVSKVEVNEAEVTATFSATEAEVAQPVSLLANIEVREVT